MTSPQIVSDKELIVEADNLKSAIKKGLAELGLTQDQIMIRIEQKEGYSIFGHREARIRILYNEEESKSTLEAQALNDFKIKFEIIYENNHLRVFIPAAFYDKHFLTNNEDRKRFLRNLLLEHRIEKPDDDLIKNIVDNFSYHNNYVDCHEYKTVPLNDEGGAIHLKFSDDRMFCEAILFFNGTITEDNIFAALKENLCIRGINRKQIQKALNSKFRGYFIIAEGKVAVDDRPSSIEKFFDDDEKNAFTKMMEMLSVDMRNVKEINISERNQLLLRIGEIINGKDGFTVSGKKLKKKNICDAASGLKLGVNVYMTDSGKEVYAKKAGHIVWKEEENSIDIESIYVVEGNVDFSEGNIMGFVGKVLIKGDVKAKFTVMAEGDIEIHGSVEDAVVKSTRGNIFIGGAVIHKNDGYVQAKGALHCLLATNAHLKGETITIEKEVMNSKLEATKSIKVIGTPGVVMGGELHARNFIQANTIGSENWVVTKVHVGDISILKQKSRKLIQDIAKSGTRISKLEETIKILSIKKERIQSLESSQETFLKNALDEIPVLKELIIEAERELERIQQDVLEKRNAKLEILNTVFPQVDIHIFDGLYTPNDPQRYTGFSCQRGQVVPYVL